MFTRGRSNVILQGRVFENIPFDVPKELTKADNKYRKAKLLTHLRGPFDCIRSKL